MMLSSRTQFSNTAVNTRTAYCPSCQTRAQFQYAGEQRWPERVARAAGIDPVVHLWHCGHCHSTISEPELKH